jgi:2-succinyl-6-hydroxy-2,4-cyclohexadiene-1-carboxylate synthase
MQLYYDVHAGTGPYVLLVHGFLSSRTQWRLNLAALARVMRPVVVELWGHGRSPAPADPAPYYPEAYIAALDQIRAQLGVERWFLCGQSFGAALTLRYALTYPDRVIAQAFTNSSAALADAEWVQARRASALQQAEEIERDGHAALTRLRVHPIHARRLPPEVHVEMLADTQLHTPGGIANTLRYATPNVPVRERVKDLRVPTLLVCGERETRFMPLRAFAEREIPGLQVVGANAGHAVNIQAAEVFNAAVVDFLGRHAASDVLSLTSRECQA